MIFNLKELSKTNYIRKAASKQNYWFSLYFGKLQDYKEKYADNFNIIIYGGEEKKSFDFYIIPFSLMKYLLVEDTISEDKRHEKRWIAAIKNHQLHIRNCPFDIDVSLYYGNPNFLDKEGIPKEINQAEQNDYAIQNRIAEIEVRVKQSVFRKNVLLNFNGRCCLSGIKETDLIIASHIVPWSKKIESRLDPSNGLFLFVTYDKLFDSGYITFDNDMKTIITQKSTFLSSELSLILTKIDGINAVRPKLYPINKEYLEYHRDTIFLR